MKKFNLIICLMSFLYIGCLTDEYETDIKYIVTGSASLVEITCMAPENYSQDNSEYLFFTTDNLPWELFYRTENDEERTYIRVENKSVADSSITVQIMVDNKIVREATAFGVGEIIELEYDIENEVL